ncbi:MAG: Hsp70 family protein [Oligosphaeraceae bacterium]|nr:Hsp70 family protein [Oligosphaeraceae bacterium]
MAIALDFGTSNSVLARWNEATGDVDVLRSPALTRVYQYRLPGEQNNRTAYVIPSLIHYGKDKRVLAGAQVENAGLLDHRGTFRWLKMDLLRERRGGRFLDGQRLDNFHAARSLLERLLLLVQESLVNAEDELVVTMPVESFDFYASWLQDTIAALLPCRLRMLDEATACILGYCDRVKNGQVYVVVDFGGGTLDVAVVKTDLDAANAGQRQPPLGRKGEELGGMLIDNWLMEMLVAAEGLSSQEVTDVGTPLLRQLEEVKIGLSNGSAEVDVTQLNPISGKLISHSFARADLQALLESKGVYRQLVSTMDGALEAANVKYGTKKSEVQGVFLVGGSSMLLGVCERVRDYFPNCPVYTDNPFEAIARGACRFAGEEISATLVHDYCLRVWDPAGGDYLLSPVVPRGTQYPTPKPFSARYVNGACEGATGLGLTVVEKSYMVRPESVYDFSDGAMRERVVVQREDVNQRVIHNARDFIQADPPCRLGDDRRFVAAFGVDDKKRLTISLRDLCENSRSHLKLSSGECVPLPVSNFPVVKL